MLMGILVTGVALKSMLMGMLMAGVMHMEHLFGYSSLFSYSFLRFGYILGMEWVITWHLKDGGLTEWVFDTTKFIT